MRVDLRKAVILSAAIVLQLFSSFRLIAADRQLIRPGFFVIAHDDSFVPFGFAEKNSDGSYKPSAGFEIEFLEKVIEKMGLKPEFKPDAWAKVLVSVKIGEADAIATIGINEERKKSYDYSDPYISYSSILFVPQASRISGLKEVQGKKVALQKNLFSIPWIRENYPQIELIQLENAKECFLAVLDGKADAAIADKLVGLYTLKKEPQLTGKLKSTGSDFAPTPVALAFPKGKASELRKDFNKVLHGVLKSSVFSDIYVKWFDQKPTSL